MNRLILLFPSPAGEAELTTTTKSSTSAQQKSTSTSAWGNLTKGIAEKFDVFGKNA